MSHVRLARSLPGLAALALALGASGCGEGAKTEVGGTIKLNGQPPKFTGLEVVFVHPNGTQVAAPVREDGTYKAEGVPAGEVMVCFAYITPDAAQQGAEFKASGGRKLTKPGEAEAPKPKPRGTPGPKTSPIPEPLRDTSTSKLTLKVEAGKPNTFDYDIK
jgi:hypothetical protein